ncbi:hypothetical protein ACN469_02915 [Corallococcus terminator]
MDPRKLGELINKPYESSEVQAFVNTLGTPEIDKELGAPKGIYYIFKPEGVTLITASATNRVSTIFLKAPLAGKPGYLKPLPYGLNFSMSRAQVLQSVRAPDGTESFYDAWEEGSHILRVEYKQGAIKMVILMGG